MTSTAKVARWFSQLQSYDQSPSLSRPESGFVSSAESRSEKNLKKSEVDEHDARQDDEYADEYLLVEGTTSLWSKLSVKKRKRLLGLKLGKVTTFWSFTRRRQCKLVNPAEQMRLKLKFTQCEREICFNESFTHDILLWWRRDGRRCSSISFSCCLKLPSEITHMWKCSSSIFSSLFVLRWFFEEKIEFLKFLTSVVAQLNT